MCIVYQLLTHWCDNWNTNIRVAWYITIIVTKVCIFEQLQWQECDKWRGWNERVIDGHVVNNYVIFLEHFSEVCINKTDKSKRWHLTFWQEKKIKPDRPLLKKGLFQDKSISFFSTMIDIIRSNSRCWLCFHPVFWIWKRQSVLSQHHIPERPCTAYNNTRDTPSI